MELMVNSVPNSKSGRKVFRKRPFSQVKEANSKPMTYIKFSRSEEKFENNNYQILHTNE